MSEKVSFFEDLAVYQRARALANEVYRVTRLSPFSRDFGLVDQVRRAAVSVLSNIAEGFERGGNAELIQFLFIAKGSCGELRAQMTLGADQQYVDERTSERLVGDCRRVSAMLSNLITYLRSSDYRGPKHAPPRISAELKATLDKYRCKSPTKADPRALEP
ncbi:MAG: four helix bundle protein [Planctomycetota bacterium]|nr:four helix bundle protein [Planctomycetota bacterium]